MKTSMPSSYRNGWPMHSGHIRPGIVLHHEEPRAHCTSIRSDNGSEDLIPVPKSSKGAQLTNMLRSVRPSKDIPPKTITDPLPNQSCWMMFQAA